ncbi:uncharacterized protein LOC111380082, partial [Olea europaea subsp. europaea]
LSSSFNYIFNDFHQFLAGIYPNMLVAMVCSLLSVEYDLKKAVRSDAARPVAKPMLSSSKSKLK